MQYLIDSGVWLRLFDRSDPEHPAIVEAMQLLESRGDQLLTCQQNIAEFWNVSTRPSTSRGGYGQSVSTTNKRVDWIEGRSLILPESSEAYREWRKILITYNIIGVSVHDARLVAMMKVAGIDRIVTLNVRDFARYPFLTAITPSDLIAE